MSIINKIAKELFDSGDLEEACGRCGIKEWNEKKVPLFPVNTTNDNPNIPNEIMVVCANCLQQVSRKSHKRMKPIN